MANAQCYNSPGDTSLSVSAWRRKTNSGLMAEWQRRELLLRRGLLHCVNALASISPLLYLRSNISPCTFTLGLNFGDCWDQSFSHEQGWLRWEGMLENHQALAARSWKSASLPSTLIGRASWGPLLSWWLALSWGRCWVSGWLFSRGHTGSFLGPLLSRWLALSWELLLSRWLTALSRGCLDDSWHSSDGAWVPAALGVLRLLTWLCS